MQHFLIFSFFMCITSSNYLLNNIYFFLFSCGCDCLSDDMCHLKNCDLTVLTKGLSYLKWDYGIKAVKHFNRYI